jgi:membrane associated rhomboid family serine protease
LTGGLILDTFGQIKRFLYQGFIPVTKSIMALTGVTFLLYWGLQLLGLGTYAGFLVLTPGNVIHLPWTLVTYPLLTPDPLGLLFGLIWLWFVGGNLERSWGSWLYLGFILSVTIVTGIVMSLVGWIFLGGMLAISDLWLPLVAVTWAWAWIYPEREMLFWGIIPIKAIWLAWINAAIIFFYYARTHWLLGLASISGILVVYLFRDRGKGTSLGYRTGNPRWGVKDWLEKRRRNARKKKFRVLH